MADVAKSRVDIPLVSPYFEDKTAGDRVDEVLKITAQQLTNFKSADAASLGGSSSTTVLSGVNSMFYMTFEDDIEDDWNLRAGSITNITYPTNGQAGGRCLQSTTEAWLAFPQNIPLDPDRLYRVRTRARATSGSGTVVVGLEGIAADGSTLVDRTGAALYTAMHEVALDAVISSGTWVTYEGYFKGLAATGTATTPSTDASAPRVLHNDVRYIRPFFVLNQGGGTGTLEIDYITLEVLTETSEIDVLVENVGGRAVGDVASTVKAGGEVADDQVSLGAMKADSVDASKIVAGSITATEIAANTITASEIFAGTITATEIAAGTITGANIAATTITASNIATGTITATQISAGTITTTQIAAGTILGTDIAATTITASNISAGTITTTEIAAGTITASNIAAGTITGSLIAAATITGSLIAAGTITASNIQASTITATQIATGTITANEIAAATIVAANITAGTITGALIAGGTISGSNIANATITGGNIAANTITAANITAGTITATEMTVSYLSSISVNVGTIWAGIINNKASSPTRGIRLDSSSSKPGTWTHYIDLSAATTDPFIQAGSEFYVLANGTAYFGGTLLAGIIGTAELAADAVTADKIDAGTITGTEINATFNLSTKTLTADTGTVGGWTLASTKLSSGDVHIDATNEQIRMGSGVTGYKVGTGFFVGDDSGTYKLHLGNPNGEFLSWDGSAFEVKAGTFTASAAEFTMGESANYRVRIKQIGSNQPGIEIGATGLSPYGGLRIYNDHDNGDCIIQAYAGAVDTGTDLEIDVAGDLLFNMAKVGFYGATPVSRPSGYTAFSNLSTDRTCNADSTSVAELADILGTLIEDLKDLGLITT